MTMKVACKIVIAFAAFILSIEPVSAFYNPSQGRWINRDPLGDEASLVYANARTDATTKIAPFHHIAGRVHGPEHSVSSFARVNANLFAAMGNDPINNIDPFGLDFSDCWSKCMDDTAPPPALSAAALANAAANAVCGRTPRGGIGTGPHPTSWQHRLGSRLGTLGSRIGKAVGRGGVGGTIALGAADLRRMAGCALSCGTPGDPDLQYMYNF